MKTGNANDGRPQELKHLLLTSILLGHLLLWPWRASVWPANQSHWLAGHLNFHQLPFKCPASDFGTKNGVNPTCQLSSAISGSRRDPLPPNTSSQLQTPSSGILGCHSRSPCVDVPSHCYRGYYKILASQFMARRRTNCFSGHLSGIYGWVEEYAITYDQHWTADFPAKPK